MAKTANSDYTVIGYTNNTQLLDNAHEEMGRTISVLSSNIFYLYRSVAEVVPQGLTEMILAINYTNGWCYIEPIF